MDSQLFDADAIPDDLRGYFVRAEIGLEDTPAAFIARLVDVFREVRRVLRDDGTCWVNMGDSYASSPPGTKRPGASGTSTLHGIESETYRETLDAGTGTKRDTSKLPGIKQKDLIGIPWMLAFALRDDGWYLRQDIIWHKPAPMPESVRDRCTKAHEYIFLLSKSGRYFYDAEAIAEESLNAGRVVAYDGDQKNVVASLDPKMRTRIASTTEVGATRNARSVWTIATSPYAEAHFATFPEALPERCIKAGTSERGCCPKCGAPWARLTEREKRKRKRPNEYVKRAGETGTGAYIPQTTAGVTVKTLGWEPTCKCDAGDPVPCRVLDPFNGSGTTGAVACKLDRDYTGIELNPEYAEMANRRIRRALSPSTFVDEREVEPSPLFRAAS